MMINALKIGRTIPTTQPCFVSSQRTVTQLQFVKAKSSAAGETEKMDKKQPQDLPDIEKDRDSMASLGEGYATRSDEEGFGGIYSGNQSRLPKDEEDEVVHGGKAPADEYDHSQGSEVKEKERARNQEKVCTS